MTQDVVKREKAYPALKNSLNYMALEASTGVTDGVSYDILEKLAGAETVEDVFAAQEAGTVSGKDYVNQPFKMRVEDIVFRKSGQDQGLPFYALMTVVDLTTGENVVLACGGANFMIVIQKLLSLDYWASRQDNEGYCSFMLVSKSAGNGDVLLLKPFVLASAPSTNGKKV